MNFHEPDLEDLIQSDLHTEMNKILHQSESTCGENSNVTKGTGTSTAPVHALVLENNSSSPGEPNLLNVQLVCLSSVWWIHKGLLLPVFAYDHLISKNQIMESVVYLNLSCRLGLGILGFKFVI